MVRLDNNVNDINDDENDHEEDENEIEDDEIIISSAPSLYIRPSYFRQTRRKRGKIIKTVTEMYLREDLGFGCHFVDDRNDNDDGTTSTNRFNRKRRLVDPDSTTTTSTSTSTSTSTVLGKPQTIVNIQHLITLLQPCTPYSIVICDTNVLLHNLDVLEQSGTVMPNIVIPQTALVECRSNRVIAYDRTVELIRSVGNGGRCSIFFPDTHHAQTAHVDMSNSINEVDTTTTTDNNNNNDSSPTNLISKKTITPNDINDARIRNVAEYFGKHLQGTNIRVILLTDDNRCRDIVSSLSSSNVGGKNTKLCYEARSVRSWVQELERYNKDISLSDLVAQYGTNNNDTALVATTGSGSTSTDIIPVSLNQKQVPVPYFMSHLEANDLFRGIQSGRFYRGVLRSINETMAMVTIHRGEERVAVSIIGSKDRNRAVDGDVVAISLNPLQKWIKSSSVAPSTASTNSSSNSSSIVTSATTASMSTSSSAAGNSSIVGIASDVAEPSLGEIANVPETMTLDDSCNWRPTGHVVGIIRRNLPTLSGSIYETTTTKANHEKKTERDVIAEQYEREHTDGTTTCVFFPVDRKMPPILIRTVQRNRLIGNRIMVTMDSWPVTSPLPLGHYVRTLGVAGSKDVETQVLLYEHNIPHEPFPSSVLACLPPVDYKIDIDNSPGREDLRHLPILSIDPPGCKDIDDALHCTLLPNGNYEVGVHIADVTHYVKSGSAIDLEAANRSTSTYLVNKRLDMLPGLLTTDLCSLKGGVDRYAFSVLWEVTPNADIVNVEFKKSIIHSIAALTYQQAQSMIDQPQDPSDIQASAVKRLALLARKFRKRRIDAGALTLASPEVKFVLDSESLNPTDVQAYALLEANAVVEEFMLLANVTVAKKILRHYPTLSVLRRHPAPNRSMFDGLISKAKCRNLVIDIEDSKRLADSLDAANDENDPYINKLLRILSTRCMSPAQYFCSGEYRAQEWHHYGLAAPVYTHFTSPIRRYADVCVHRLLAAAIGVAPLPQHLSSRSYLHDLCENMNRRHRSAQLAGRASVQLHTLIFFAGDGAKEEYAYVLDIETTTASEPSFTVMVPRYGIEGRVKISIASDDPNLKRIPEEHKLVYGTTNSNNSNSQTETILQVFDRVKVKLWVRESDDHHRELVIDLIEPKFHTSESIVTRQENLETQSTADDNPKKSKQQKKVKA